MNWLARNRVRERLTPLLEGELAPLEAERVTRAIAGDARLRAEFELLREARASLRALPAPHLPEDLGAELALTRLLAVKPLRERYGELLDNRLPAARSAALRAQIAADPELAAEFELLQAGLTLWRAEPALPVPAFLSRRLKRLAAEHCPQPVPRPAPRRAPLFLPRPRLAWVSVSAVLVMGLALVRFVAAPPVDESAPVGPRLAAPARMAAKPAVEAPATAPAPLQPVVETPSRPTPAPVKAAPVPVPTSASTPPPAPARRGQPSHARPRPEPVVKVATQPNPAGGLPANGARPTASTAGIDATTSNTPHVKAEVAWSPPANSAASSASAARDQIPDPALLNNVEPAASPASIQLASDPADSW
jgi:anti-sigma factor RsiW